MGYKDRQNINNYLYLFLITKIIVKYFLFVMKISLFIYYY